MSTSPSINRQWVLNARPTGEPDANTLRWVESPVPTPGQGQMLLRTVFLSLDPYMRGRMSDAPSYAKPVRDTHRPCTGSSESSHPASRSAARPRATRTAYATPTTTVASTSVSATHLVRRLMVNRMAYAGAGRGRVRTSSPGVHRAVRADSFLARLRCH